MENREVVMPSLKLEVHGSSGDDWKLSQQQTRDVHESTTRTTVKFGVLLLNNLTSWSYRTCLLFLHYDCTTSRILEERDGRTMVDDNRQYCDHE